MKITASKEEIQERGTFCAKDLWCFAFTSVNQALALMRNLARECFELDGFEDAFRAERHRLLTEE